MTARTIVMAFVEGRPLKEAVLLHAAFVQDYDAIGDRVGDEPGRDVQFVVQAPEPCPWKPRLGAGALL